VRFRPMQIGATFDIGFNSDPLTDQNFTSIDRAWHLGTDGIAYVFESGALILPTRAYTTNDIFEIRYDGKFVTYFINGVQWRTIADPAKTFFFDSSFFTPGGGADNVYFGALNPANSSPFVARGQCKVSDESITKVGGTSAWDSDVYSLEGYPTAHVSWKANQTNADLIIGLGVNPGQDSSYTSINFGMQCVSTTSLGAQEGNTFTPLGATYSTSDVLAVTCDGTTISYLKNGVVLRTKTLASVGLPNNTPVFMDSSFAAPNCGVNTLQFGPTTMLQLSDTSQIGLNAASGYVSLIQTGFSITQFITPSGVNASGFADTLQLAFIAGGNPIGVDITADLDFQETETNTGSVKGMFSMTVQVYRVLTTPGWTYAGAVPIGTVVDLKSILDATAQSSSHLWWVRQVITISATDSPAANSVYPYIYLLRLVYSQNGSGGSPFAGGNVIGGHFTANSVAAKIREYKR
jgi:hypothetical protein